MSWCSARSETAPDGADFGITNIRNLSSKHWTRWFEPDNRCIVPFTSFSAFNKAESDDIWFARNGFFGGSGLACLLKGIGTVA